MGMICFTHALACCSDCCCFCTFFGEAEWKEKCFVYDRHRGGSERPFIEAGAGDRAVGAFTPDAAASWHVNE